MSNVSKGKQYENEVQLILESQGYRVERAFNKTTWIKDKKNPGRMFPISISHDFWNCIDVMAVKEDVPPIFASVTVWENIAPRIKKMKEIMPNNAHYDACLWARIRNERPVHFRVLHQKDNYTWKGEAMILVKNKK